MHFNYSTIFIFFISCQNVSIEKNLPMNWNEFDLALPKGISILKGENKSLPLKAWVAKIDLDNPNIMVRILSSSDKDRKNTPNEFLDETGARVVINGGFLFQIEPQPSM